MKNEFLASTFKNSRVRPNGIRHEYQTITGGTIYPKTTQDIRPTRVWGGVRGPHPGQPTGSSTSRQKLPKTSLNEQVGRL